MSNNVLPVTIDFGTIPQTGQGYTPQQFANRLGLNGRIFTEQSFALFTTGATAPTSDTGPWAKDGNTWYYWDSVSGSYVPFIVPPESLRYSVSATTPDPNIYLFWIKLDGGGQPLGVFTYYSGAWTDVYGATGYMTVAAFNAAIANYSTTAQMNTAIANAIAAIPPQTPFASYPADAGNTVPQSIPTTDTPTKIDLGAALVNPAPAPFDTGTSQYIAPAAGIYSVSASTLFDNDTGTASAMKVSVFVYVNGVDTGIGDTDGTPSPTDDAWTPSFGGILVNLGSGDTIELYAVAKDGGVHAINLTSIHFSVFRVSA